MKKLKELRQLEINTLLIHQASMIEKAIRKAKTFYQCDTVRAELRLVREFWIQAGYFYRIKELNNQLKLKERQIAEEKSDERLNETVSFFED